MFPTTNCEASRNIVLVSSGHCNLLWPKEIQSVRRVKVSSSSCFPSHTTYICPCVPSMSRSIQAPTRVEVTSFP